MRLDQEILTDPDNMPPRSRLFLVVPKTADANLIEVTLGLPPPASSAGIRARSNSNAGHLGVACGASVPGIPLHPTQRSQHPSLLLWGLSATVIGVSAAGRAGELPRLAVLQD